MKLNSVKIVPLAALERLGWDEVEEGSQDFFATLHYDNHKGYGEGWMPLFDFECGTKADAYRYMYRNKADAMTAIKNFSEKNA